MSRSSINCLIALTFFLISTYLVMPYMVPSIGPSVGLSVSEITWGLGICNAIAAVTLYARPSFKKATSVLGLIALAIFLGIGFLAVGVVKHAAWLVMVGLAMMRITLINYSDFNRQIHMQTNSNSGIKRAFSAANVISNVVSSSVPFAASLIIVAWGVQGLTQAASLLTVVFGLVILFLFFLKSNLNGIVIAGRPPLGNTFKRFLAHSSLYSIVLINSIIFSFVFSFIPLKITQYGSASAYKVETLIGLYFAVNSLAIAVLSFPVLKLCERLNIKDRIVIDSSSVCSILSMFCLVWYSGGLISLVGSALLLSVAEILFIPFIIAHVASSDVEKKDMVLKDVTLLNVSLSAALSAPIAGMLHQGGNKSLVLTLIFASIVLVLSHKKMAHENK